MARPTHRRLMPMPLVSRPFGIGGGCCVLAPLFRGLFRISTFSAIFHWSFFRLALVRPHCAGSRGSRCGHQGESPADLMAATDLRIPPLLVCEAGKSIFLPMILFGEGARLHYLYCTIQSATASFARLKRRAAL